MQDCNDIFDILFHFLMVSFFKHLFKNIFLKNLFFKKNHIDKKKLTKLNIDTPLTALNVRFIDDVVVP